LQEWRQKEIIEMRFDKAIASGFKKCVTFSGRASRSEYWYWWLFSILMFTAVSMLMEVPIGDPYTDVVLGRSYVAIQPPIFFYIRWFITPVVCLAILVPGLSVSIRRLHDVNHRGWWVIIYFIPYLGVIILLLWFCDKGTQGINRFGADPLPVSDVQQASKRRWNPFVLFMVLLLIAICFGIFLISFFSK
jgi:uncharacterized membrane protein YhaH (DUF805 family)